MNKVSNDPNKGGPGQKDRTPKKNDSPQSHQVNIHVNFLGSKI